MKLAEALTLRADTQKRIAQLRSRLYNNAKVQEGEKPAEEPAALLAELDTAIESLEELIRRINMTNSVTVSGKDTLSALLAKRDCLNMKNEIMREFLSAASSTAMRETRSEIKIVSTVSVAELQKQVDNTSKQLRELDVTIQALNWTTELQ